MLVCIISKPDDIHAIYTELALRKKGVNVINWHWESFPSLEGVSVEITENGRLNLSKISGNWQKLSVWVHRGLKPHPAEHLHPSDIKFVTSEASFMLRGILTELEKHAFCVNPSLAVHRLKSKINEITLAKKCGLSIPPTLVSNQVETIKSFLIQHGKVIIKHNSPMYWESSADQTCFQPYTTKIKMSQLQNAKQVALCPSIFQKEINKQFELRIVFMGNTIFVIKINSQKTKRSTDWRIDYKGRPPCSVFSLPKNELQKIRSFILASGLFYGSVDMIVDQQGNYIFLEVNETGQFLWIEELLPQLPLLDCFANLLASRDKNYAYRETKCRITASELDSEVTFDDIQERAAQHISITNHTKLVE